MVQHKPRGSTLSSPSNSEGNLPSMQEVPAVARTGEYRLYRRRWIGLLALCALNIAGGMNWLWFSAIALKTSEEFSWSIRQVNWLSNSVNLIYLPVSCIIPIVCQRIGVRSSCMIGAGCLFVAAWLRYAGTAKSLSPAGSYILIFLGQCLAGIGQPWFQVLAPRYSELWFDTGGRTSATMLASLANPIGSALAQLLSPMVGTPRQSILVLGIITSVLASTVFAIGHAPPTPPTFAGSQQSPPAMDTLRAFLGKSSQKGSSNPAVSAMTYREKCDFIIILFGFGVLVAAITTFSILVNQIFAPYGYSEDTAGLLGAALFLAGLVGAVVTAPLFDRVFTHHLAITVRALVPVVAVGWIAMIFAVKRDGIPGICVCLIIIGFGSFTLLPVSLELACEITRNPEASSAALWFLANLLSVIFVLIDEALRSGPTSDPPYNLRNALILQGSFTVAAAILALGLRGKQVRREMDLRLAEQRAAVSLNSTHQS